MHTLSRIAVLSSMLLSVVAWAQTPKPRVMIILDTSRSMMETPVFTGTPPFTPDTLIPVEEATQGDYNMATNNNCTSKFCMAKKAVNQVLPAYTPDARIGLATYYQYVMKADSTNSLTTACAYDVLAPPDVRKRFASLTDYTGSGTSVCTGNALSDDATCVPGSTRTTARFFPDSTLGGMMTPGLNDFCPRPTGVPVPTNPSLAPTACSGDLRNCYVLTKVAAAPATSVDCNVYTWPLPALPHTYPSIAANGGGCVSNIPYSQVASSIVYRSIMPRIEQIISLSNTTCPTPVAPTTNPGATPPSVVLTGNPTVGNNVGDWRNFFGAGENCNGDTACSLFSYSATPVERFNATSWYGFFNNTFTPSGTLTGLSGAHQFSQYAVGSAPYTPTVLTGSVLVPNGTACLGGAWPLGTGVGTTTRYVSGSLAGSFGVSNPQNQADNSAIRRTPPAFTPARTDDTPTRAGNNYNCTAGYPCDVRLSADVDVPGAWVNDVATIFADVYNPANERTTALTADGFSLRLLAPATTCPAINSSATLPANSAWHLGGPGGCTGSGAGACTFTSAGSGTVSTASCGNVVRWSNLGASATAPANCMFNNKAYTGPAVSTDIAVTRTIINPSTCNTGTFDITSAGSPAYVGCGAYPCKLSFVNSAPGLPESSSWAANRYVRASPPTGFSGTAVRDETIGTVNGPSSSSAPSCIGGNGTWVAASAPLCPGGAGSCTLWQVGPQQISATGCGAENGPCNACVYEQKRFQWDRPTTRCNYTTNTYTFTVDQTAPRCNYTRSRWQLDRREPDRHRCEYQVGARRYDFAPPREKVCEYWAVRSTMRSPRFLYTYEYKTNGTELIGRASAVATGSNMCGGDSSGSYPGALATSCPETTSCGAFPSMVNRSSSLGGGNGPVSAAATCKLHWGGGDHPSRTNGYTPYSGPTGVACGGYRCRLGDTCSSGVCYASSAATRGRYWYASSTASFESNPLTSTASRLCQEDPAGLPASPDAYQNTRPTAAAPGGFCSNSGLPTQTNYYLVSDYYDPSVTNSLTATYTGTGCAPVIGGLGPPPQPDKPCFRTAGANPPFSAVSWTQTAGVDLFNTNTNTKVQGFGGRTGVSAGPSGDVPPLSVFVPIPDDLSYDDATQASRLQAATSLCVKPSADVSPADGVQDGPNADGSLRGGACVADFADKSSGAAYADYTPLFGSIKNAADYLVDRWNTDTEPQGKDCRDYFIILATDGQERTPANFTLTGGSATSSVEGLVTSIRNTSGTFPRTHPDIRTFVIGFGDGAAGAGVVPLNAVANAGGTTNAFFPSSLADLQNTLNAVFTTILAGQESRARPAIGTDGTRIYAASYVKPAGAGPDWYGLLTAYAVDNTTGATMVAWDHHAKLDDVGHPPRVIKAIVDHNDHTHSDDFEPGLNWRDTPMDTHWDYIGSLPDAGTPNISEVINFVRFRNQPYDRLFAGAVVNRASALAPIVNSSPIVVGKSPFDDSYGGATSDAREEFRDFVTATASRGTRIYFGSTEGMIHSVREGSDAGVCASESAIGCTNGHEAWAALAMNLRLKEVPSEGQATIGESLFKLKSTGSWAMNMLNGPVVVADVCNEDSDYDGPADECDADEWRTVLIATMREGGRGMIALNITNHTRPNGTSWSGNNGVLWHFHDGNLGLTYSAPAVGRVRFDGEDKFVAFFGGGADDPGTGAMEGDTVFVVDALRRDEGVSNQPIVHADMWQYQVGATPNNNFSESIVARPASYRRPGSPYMDTGYVAAGNTLYASRFAQPNGTQWNTRAQWEPDTLFDPTSVRNDKQATSPAINTVVNRVVQYHPGNPADPLDPPLYRLDADGTLPLSSAPPILNRPRVGNVLIASGKPDLFVGTGNIDTPNAPGPAFADANYFYAIHDFNDQFHAGGVGGGGQNDGRALWVSKFCNGQAGVGSVDCTNTREQVVSEPALISSCIIVATYTPSSASSCGSTGDTTLYGFNALTGALTSCLIYPPGSPWQGTTTPAIRLNGVGIPSDLVVINDNLYFTASNSPGINQVGVRHTPRPGAIRSYRRLK
ncbi:MAG: PilC/PilY family type IV pilus protein [Myxococcales bacterium]|nr:PilC/PilY family type IV pilus protein [Myxococcales bacterium]